MYNLRNTVFYRKTNVLQDFHIYISVPLINAKQMLRYWLFFKQ